MGVVDLALAGGLILACLLLSLALWRLRAVDRRHRALLGQLPRTAITVFDHDLRIRFAAGSASDLGGLGADEVVGRFLLGHIPQAQREPLLDHCRAALRGEQRSFEYRAIDSGRDYWVRMVPLADRRGEVTGGLSVAIDVSDRRELERAAGSPRAAVDSVADATRALARSVDPAAARMAVCEGAREVAQAPVAALFEPAQRGSVLVPRAWTGAELGGLELPLRDESGATQAFTRADAVFVALGTGDGEADRSFMRRAGAKAVLWQPVIKDRAALGVLAIGWHEAVAGVPLRLSAMVDLLGAEAAVAIGRADTLGRLERMARTDGLTGLPNRRHWEEELPRELARARRQGHGVCVAVLDLDHFKDYNDRRGHQAGDRMLAAAGVAWRAALRPYDVLARYGGEEFSLILPSCGLDEALLLVERLRAVTPEGESCSAGVAEWDGEESPDGLVGRADAALYRAKRGGRDQAVAANAV